MLSVWAGRLKRYFHAMSNCTLLESSLGENQALVSVIMPAYNASPYIGEAIRSVIDQDYPNIELIVVDDGSVDGSAEVAESFGSRVKVIRQANAGVAAARNRGLAAARGELIAFLDADDLWLPGKLSAQVAYLSQHPETAVVYGVFTRWHAKPDGSFDPPPVPVVQNPQSPIVADHSGWIYTELLLGSIVHVITAMIRRDVADRLGGFDESLPTGEDYDFWLRMSRQFRAVKLNRVLAYYRIHSTSITKVPRAENNEYAVLKKTLNQYGLSGPDGRIVEIRSINNRLFLLCFSHGYFHYWKGDPACAARFFKLSLQYKRFSPRTYVYFILASFKRLFGKG